jgi:hypothetical protein
MTDKADMVEKAANESEAAYHDEYAAGNPAAAVFYFYTCGTTPKRPQQWR